MGHLTVLLTLLFLLVPPAICNTDYHALFKCMSNHHAGNDTKILESIHFPNSPMYISLLEYATQNPRWFNITIQRPLLIVAPRQVTEIQSLIRCSKSLGIQIRVKSGGHDYEGLSFRSKTPFFMIDLVNLNATAINVEEETAWIQTGVTLGQLYYEIANKSKTLAFPGGLYPGVGSGGHISGGGLGTLLRKYGLASDHVIDARIMDVNGAILDRKKMGEDLFWAIRGGGGASFGVILSWKLKLVRVPEQVTVFTIRRKMDPENLNLLQKWHNTAYKLTDDLFIRALLTTNGGPEFGLEKIVQVSYNGLFLGTADKLVSVLNENFPDFDLETNDCLVAPPLVFNCSDRPCMKKDCHQLSWIQSVLFFSFIPPDFSPQILLNKVKNQNNFGKAASDFLKAPIPERGWKMIHDMLLSEDSPMMILDPFGGKMDEISEDETPFPHRKGNLFNIQYMTKWGVNNETEAKKHLKWIRRLYRKMRPYVAECPRTAYLNYKDLGLGKNDKSFSYDQGKVWGEKYFKGNFERLARVKGKVDPENFFKNEQSIPVLV